MLEPKKTYAQTREEMQELSTKESIYLEKINTLVQNLEYDVEALVTLYNQHKITARALISRCSTLHRKYQRKKDEYFRLLLDSKIL